MQTRTKVRTRTPAEAVVGGVVGTLEVAEALLLGRPDADGGHASRDAPARYHQLSVASWALNRWNAGSPDMRRPGVSRSDQITCGDFVPHPPVLGRTTICPSYPRQDVTCTPVGSSANANSNCACSGGGGSKRA